MIEWQNHSHKSSTGLIFILTRKYGKRLGHLNKKNDHSGFMAHAESLNIFETPFVRPVSGYSSHASTQLVLRSPEPPLSNANSGLRNPEATSSNANPAPRNPETTSRNANIGLCSPNATSRSPGSGLRNPKHRSFLGHPDLLMCLVGVKFFF